VSVDVATDGDGDGDGGRLNQLDGRVSGELMVGLSARLVRPPLYRPSVSASRVSSVSRALRRISSSLPPRSVCAPRSGEGAFAPVVKQPTPFRLGRPSRHHHPQTSRPSREGKASGRMLDKLHTRILW